MYNYVAKLSILDNHLIVRPYGNLVINMIIMRSYENKNRLICTCKMLKNLEVKNNKSLPKVASNQFLPSKNFHT